MEGLREMLGEVAEDVAAVDAPGLRRALLEIFLVFLLAGVLVTGLVA